jgi:hypothetical protein
MATTPGYGTEQVHLGLASSALSKTMGKPSLRRKSGVLREYWVYPDQHFEAIVSLRSNRLLSLFFHQGSTLAGAEFFGQREADIRQQFGKPYKEGGGVTFTDGDYLGRWLSYSSGIAFFFDQAGTVKTVCISAKSKAVRSKLVVSHGQSHLQKAALVLH